MVNLKTLKNALYFNFKGIYIIIYRIIYRIITRYTRAITGAAGNAGAAPPGKPPEQNPTRQIRTPHQPDRFTTYQNIK